MTIERVLTLFSQFYFQTYMYHIRQCNITFGSQLLHIGYRSPFFKDI